MRAGSVATGTQTPRGRRKARGPGHPGPVATIHLDGGRGGVMRDISTPGALWAAESMRARRSSWGQRLRWWIAGGGAQPLPGWAILQRLHNEAD